MTHQPTPTADFELLDYGESLTDQTIAISTAQVERAIQISQPILNSRRRWQIYLHALAWLSFESWLAEWAFNLPVNQNHCSLLQPQYANLLEPACNLQVGDFNLCVIAVGSLMDSMITIPKAVVDLPPFTPHIYVLVEVLEEQMQAKIYGYLRHDQIVEQLQSEPLASSNWSYFLPLAWFTANPRALLLDLRYLKPDLIPIPTVVNQHLLPIVQLQARLKVLQAKLQSPKHLPEEMLTWEEGATLLMYPELVDQLYKIQCSAIDQSSSAVQTPSLSSPLSQPVMNVGLWLQDQLDEVAQALSWVLMPPFIFANSALRSTVKQFDQVSSELASRGVVIPSGARGAYQDLPQNSFMLRLYAVTWMLPAVEGTTPEWVLLLALGEASGAKMPAGIRLRVEDATQLLAEQSTLENTQNSYLCIQALGGWSEQFRVTIDPVDGNTVYLPPFAFAFNPDAIP